MNLIPLRTHIHVHIVSYGKERTSAYGKVYYWSKSSYEPHRAYKKIPQRAESWEELRLARSPLFGSFFLHCIHSDSCADSSSFFFDPQLLTSLIRAVLLCSLERSININLALWCEYEASPKIEVLSRVFSLFPPDTSRILRERDRERERASLASWRRHEYLCSRESSGTYELPTLPVYPIYSVFRYTRPRRTALPHLQQPSGSLSLGSQNAQGRDTFFLKPFFFLFIYTLA